MAVSVETNGPKTAASLTSGHKMNGKTTQKADVTAQKPLQDEQVTKAFSEFVVKTSQKDITEPISTKLKALLLDYVGVCVAAGNAGESTPSILAGIAAFSASAKGECSVFTKGSSFPSQYAALLNGALAHTYDYDDTHGPAVLHPGASIISAAIAECESQNLTGADLLLALTVGYEVAIRLGMAMGVGSYKQGFHTTSTAGIFGSVAAICKLRNCSVDTVENAFGLAISKASGSMQFLENGSWNKRIHPGFAAHDAILCVCLAEAGVLGASSPIEGKYGLLNLFTSTPNPAHLLSSLGQKWNLLGTACKPFPACRMTHGQIEIVGRMRRTHSSLGVPSKITIHLPAANYPIVGVPSPNKVHPKTIVDAQFSSYYQTAACYLHGITQGWSIYDHLSSSTVSSLADRISVSIDDSYVNLESRMTFEWDDGTVEDEEEVVFPLAEPQKPFEWDTGVQKKFLGLATPVYGVDEAESVARVVGAVEGVNVRELMTRLAC